MKRHSYHKKLKFKLKKETIYNISTIALLGVAFIVGLSFFSTSPYLTKINTLVQNYFGWGGLVLPILLLMLAFGPSKLRPKWLNINIYIGLALIWIALLGLTKAGLVGLTVWSNIEIFLTGVGAFFLLSGALLIGLIVLFNTSLEEIAGIFSSIFKVFGDSFGTLKKALNFQKQKPIYMQGQLPMKIKPFNQPNQSVPLRNDNKLPVKGATGFQPTLSGENVPMPRIWDYPSLSLFADISGQKADRGDVKNNASIIEKTLDSFGVIAKVAEVNKGPAVTQYALSIAQGTKLSKITTLQNDLALALAAPTGQIRIEAPIPGKSLVGVEIPNRSLEFVTLKTMLSSDIMKNAKSKLTVALGLDVSGQPVVTDIAKMPHVLIAGTTGSGKSVLINSWIASLLYRTTPEEVRLILVDPKRVELTGYNGIPHLLSPVIVEPDKILSALKWAISQMEERYKQFAAAGVRNIEGYHNLSGIVAMPYIIIFIDELADLMSFAPVDVEDSICRIAQMARATGIHLVLSTQRPSVDVITGLIKANIPCRIAFNVSSMIDSRVILDQPGAEKLLGRGDMLYIPPEQAKPSRIQGTFVSEKEISDLVQFIKTHNTPAQYTAEVITQPVAMRKVGGAGGQMITSPDGRDPLYESAVKLIIQHNTASSSFLQRKLSVGFSRAARIMDQMEEEGIIAPQEGSKPRDVLIKNTEQIFGTPGPTQIEG